MESRHDDRCEAIPAAGDIQTADDHTDGRADGSGEAPPAQRKKKQG